MLKSMDMQKLLWVFVAVFISGCAGLIDPQQAKNNPAFSFLNSYESALSDYQKGRIMRARNRVLAMDKSREDYPQALKLLRTKIDPARLRLLRHYTRKARDAERARRWSDAMAFYAHAAELNTTPKALIAKRDEMELKMRQLRMDTLIAQRRIEDSQLLGWLNAYDAPRGVAPKDESFSREREHLQDFIEERGSLAYREARRYLSKDLPEIAYIEIESYLRLVPDSERGKRLMADVKEEMPKGIRISSVKSGSRKSLSKRVALPETVKREQVLALIRKGDWVKAKRFALVYRREGGKDAKRLLKQIQTSTDKEAANYFARGRLAFRQEKLELAIRFWERAAELVPENGEYASALQRARQLQEQLKVLQETEAGKAE